MATDSLIDRLRVTGARSGLNLVAAVPVWRYDANVTEAYRASAIDPAARSILVIGSGGGALWESLRAHCGQNPRWMERENPLDDFTRTVVERDVETALGAASIRYTTVYPFMSGARTLNFIELGKAAGLGGPSIIGVAVHPRFGPWIAFRAAMLTDCELEAPGEAVGFDPCPGCVPRSCIAACPVGAVTFPTGWNVRECLTHRVEVEPDCATRCHARVGCVLGPEHRYPDDELAYHQRRALGSMRAYYERHIRPARTE